MRALGTQIHRTPTEAPSDSPESNIHVAAQLCKKLHPNVFQPNQYDNPGNPEAHFQGTAEEIWTACEGKVDVVVMGAGTGGTITGVAQRLRELNPNIVIIGVDPYGSILGGDGKESVKPYQVEGIGYDFIPKVLDPRLVNHWVKVTDRDSFRMARRLIRREGILCGGSSGSAMLGAIQAAKMLKLGADKRIVVIFPDSVRNYMSKFLADEWMLIHGFSDPSEMPWAETLHQRLGTEPLGTRLTHQGSIRCQTVDEDATGEEIARAFRQNPQMPFMGVLDHEGVLIGAISRAKFLTKYLVRGSNEVSTQKARRHMEKEFGMVRTDTSMSEAAILCTTGYPIFLWTAEHSLALLTSEDFLA